MAGGENAYIFQQRTISEDVLEREILEQRRQIQFALECWYRCDGFLF